jgi:hypothetical protein
MRKRAYVGTVRGEPLMREVVMSARTPTTAEYGERYIGVDGPFRTRRDADGYIKAKGWLWYGDRYYSAYRSEGEQ